MQLLRHSLNVVQTLNTNDELDALELLFQPRNALLIILFSKNFFELIWINADRTAGNYPSLNLDPVGCPVKPTIALAPWISTLRGSTYSRREQLLKK